MKLNLEAEKKNRILMTLQKESPTLWSSRRLRLPESKSALRRVVSPFVGQQVMNALCASFWKNPHDQIGAKVSVLLVMWYYVLCRTGDTLEKVANFLIANEATLLQLAEQAVLNNFRLDMQDPSNGEWAAYLHMTECRSMDDGFGKDGWLDFFAPAVTHAGITHGVS